MEQLPIFSEELSGSDKNNMVQLANTTCASANETNRTIDGRKQVVKISRAGRNLTRNRIKMTAWTLEDGVHQNENGDGAETAVLQPT